MQSKLLCKISKNGFSFKITFYQKKYNVIFYAANGQIYSKSFHCLCSAYKFYHFIINNQFFQNSSNSKSNNNQLSLFNRG